MTELKLRLAAVALVGGLLVVAVVAMQGGWLGLVAIGLAMGWWVQFDRFRFARGQHKRELERPKHPIHSTKWFDEAPRSRPRRSRTW